MYKLIIISLLLIILICLFKNYSLEQFENKKCNIPVFYINLDRSKDRKIRLEKQLSKYFSNYNRISGIDGNNLKPNIFKNSFDDINYDFTDFKNWDKRAKPESVIGTLLSHMKAIRQINKLNYDYAIIMEDDLDFKYKNKWNISIQEIMNNAPSDWQLIKLTPGMNKLDNNIKLYNNKITYRKLLKEEWCMGCYIINKKFIKKTLNYIQNNKFKINKEKNPNLASDYFLLDNIKGYEFTKPLFCFYEDKSLIDDYSTSDKKINEIIKNFYNNR